MGRRNDTPATARRNGGGEAGFTIIESTLALGLMFAVLVGLLATLAGTTKAVVASKQRNAAVALASEVLEQARGFSYASVGHDFVLDGAALAEDPEVEGAAPDFTYRGEPLVGSNRSGAHEPFAPYRFTRTVDTTEFEVRTYVTLVNPATQAPAAVGNVYKRISVLVTWDQGQYSHEGAAEVRNESFLYNAVEPPDPLLRGVANADAGIIHITGNLQAVDLNEALYWFPTSYGEIDARFIRRIKGFATSPRALLSLNNPVTSDADLGGCTIAGDKRSAECAGVKAESVADNDAGTAPELHDTDSATRAGGTVQRVGSDNFTLRLHLGNDNNVSSKSSALAFLPDFDVDTDLPYHRSEGTGPGSMALWFATQSVSGDLVRATGDASARTVVARSGNGEFPTISSLARITHPALDILRLDASETGLTDHFFQTIPGGWQGLVRLGASDVQAEARAGPGAGASVLPTGDVSVTVFTPRTSEDQDYTPYTTYSLPIGEDHQFTVGTVDAPVVVHTGNRRVELSGRVTTSRTVTSTNVTGEVVDEAEVSLKTWLRVEARIRVFHGTDLRADLLVDLDYGRLLATALYEPAP